MRGAKFLRIGWRLHCSKKATTLRRSRLRSWVEVHDNHERLEEYTHQELYKELKTNSTRRGFPGRKKATRNAYGEVEKQCKSQLVQHFKGVLVSELRVRNLPSERNEMITYMANLKKERDAVLEAKARDDEEADEGDDDDSDGLVSSPSAKRRKLRRTNSLHAEDLEGRFTKCEIECLIIELFTTNFVLKNSTGSNLF